MANKINDVVTDVIYKNVPGNPVISPVATKFDLELKINGIAAGITQADSTAIDVAGVVADLNTLLANLRTAGILA